MHEWIHTVLLCLIPAMGWSPGRGLPEHDSRAMVLKAEAARIEMIRRVAPSVVCVFDKLKRGGGSGVLIDEDGYGITNFHVVAPLLNTRRGLGGLGDGILYELEVLGIDVTGDVAMFRLIPPKTPYRFPHAALGDSDRVRVGDQALAMGNPFTLSEDYSPTVTMGIVTGTNRYQAGVRGNLTYTDCLQVDASINPGNSGGPLFNRAGEVIGINGRISVNTRGRFNVGFGYAISSNQIKRFIPALRAGLLARHGTWKATVKDDDGGGVVFDRVRRSGPAYRAGVREGDALLALDGVRVRSANHVLSLLGTYPEDWPVLLRTRRGRDRRELVVRLDPVSPNMPQPFLEDRSINEREVRRVLRAFQRAVFQGGEVRPPALWRWVVVRDQHPLESGATAPEAERFAVTFRPDQPVRMEARWGNGQPGRVIEYDDRSASLRMQPEAQPTDILAEKRAVLNALYLMQQTLLIPLEQLDLAEVRYVGADAIVTSLPPESLALRPLDDRRRIDWPTTEVLEWPIGDDAVARLGFDSTTSDLTRIRIKNLLTESEWTVDLSDHRDIGGLRWPTAIEVRGPDEDYCDTLTEWELSK